MTPVFLTAPLFPHRFRLIPLRLGLCNVASPPERSRPPLTHTPAEKCS
jgi:hypothetical protein